MYRASKNSKRSLSKNSRKSTNTKPLYKPFKSTTLSKKWDVYVIDPKTKNIKKVSFGAAGYQDFTQHKDENRRASYRVRHVHDHIDDITKAGAWSWWVLWGDTSNMRDALKFFLAMHNIK
jgi:hypothetical protein